jgi:glycosyltransferase involved in cell wall biosynthesis
MRATGKEKEREERERVHAGFAPHRLVDIELSEPLPDLRPELGDLGIPYAAAVCLIRLHGAPIGYMHVDLGAGGVDAEELAALISSEVGREVALHLRRDGIDGDIALTAAGLQGGEDLPCTVSYREFLEQAGSVTVVIPTRNRPRSALETVRSVLESDYPRDRFDVIVVDNGSGDDAPFDAAELDASSAGRVRVIREPVPGGSNARNAGLAAASAEIVVFTDDDVEVDRSWLGSLVRVFGTDERVGGVAGMVVPREMETPPQLWFEGYACTIRRFESVVLDIEAPPPGLPLFPFTVGDLGSGQNMAFRRQALLELGGFDPDLGTATPALGGEDVEAMLRVLLAGHVVVYEPRAIVKHAQERDFAAVERRVYGYGVGLTACLAKSVLTHPPLLRTLLLKLPYGFAYALSPRSPKNRDKQHDFPRHWTRLELRGMLVGPALYGFGRVKRRLSRRRSGSRRLTQPDHG